MCKIKQGKVIQMLKVTNMYKLNSDVRYELTCDEKVEIKEKIYSKLVDNGRSELFCESTNIEGVYHFGCKQLTDSYDHKAGYIWSSRAGCINGQFGTQLYDDTSVNNSWIYHLDINILKPLVEEFTGKKYRIEQFYSSYDKEKEEPRYKLVEVE